ncbi:MAG: SurA N-terminal domain-containing protein [Candidatus Saccharimonadales bacterium]
MKKPKRTKKPKLPKVTKRPFNLLRKKTVEEKVSDAISNVPRITNETVSDHREEVLSSARKFIYPLEQSKHRIVRLSISILIVVLILFISVVLLALYKFQSTSTFFYDVTQVLPLPVAKEGNSWISYESYLFELRHDIHYYHDKQHVDFSTPSGKAQLVHLKQQALNQVVLDAEVKQLAAKNHVSVSNSAVNNQIALVRAQNRLGSNDEVFKEVLNNVYGWSEDDFKRELKQQLLQQAVVAKLDTGTALQAQTALNQIVKGASFESVATQYTNDATTKANGGHYANPISPADSNISPVVTAQLFKLKPGQVSNVINTGYTLEILKVIAVAPGSVTAAHIQFNLQPISKYIAPISASNPVHKYITI